MLPLCIFVPEVDSMPMPTYPGNESDIDSATSDAWTATSDCLFVCFVLRAWQLFCCSLCEDSVY